MTHQDVLRKSADPFKRRWVVGCSISGLLLFAIITAFVVLSLRDAGWRNSPQSPLFTADTAAAAETAIANGESVNEKDRYNRTPLHRAAAFGLTDVVRVLLSHNADVSAREDDGDTPLHLAVGELPDPDEGLVSSAYARLKSPLETVRLLVQDGADVNAMNAQGATPLFAAVMTPNNLDVVLFLIKSGANVRVRDADLNSPLYLAVKFNYSVEIVRRLLSAGAEPNVQERWFRETPLHVAAKNGNIEIVRLLLADGANPNLRDRDGKSPADRTTDPAIRAILTGKPSP